MKHPLIHTPSARHDTEQRSLKQATKSAALVLLAGLLALTNSEAAPALPPARELLATARFQQTQQSVDLQGQLREGALIVPFRITQSGPVIKYSFANPAGALLLRLGENDSQLQELGPGGAAKVAPAQFDHKVRGTAVTYEDLSLNFLYWPEARVTGEETIRTRAAWKLRLQAPAHASQYAYVLLWIDKQSGALIQLEGYNAQANLLKRFEVVSAQKIEGRWYLKQMRIEQMQPGTGAVQSRTYLEIKNS